MIYAFDAEVSAPKGKLSREDRGEIRDYMAEVRVEASDPDRAVKQLAKQLQVSLTFKLLALSCTPPFCITLFSFFLIPFRVRPI